MRITTLAQTQGQIPDQFRGNPLHADAKACIALVNALTRLSPAEIDWILAGLEDNYHLISNAATTNWRNTTKQLEMVFDYARKTGKNVLNYSLTDISSEAAEDSVNRSFEEAFARCPIGRNLLRDVDTPVKNALVRLNSVIDGGLNDSELQWIATKNAASNSLGALSMIVNWARATDKQLSTINDFGTANVLAQEWQDYKDKSEAAKKLSKSGIRTVVLSGKWKAVWVDPSKISNDGTTMEWELEEQIVGSRLTGNQNKVISIRDPNGVPQATVEIDAETPDRINVLMVGGTQSGKEKVKELAKKLANTGTRMWWDGEEDDESVPIRKLPEHANNEYGFVPRIYVDEVGTITNKDDYFDVLKLAYQEGWGGSSYYPRVTNKIFDALADYAEQRNELNELEKAREKFEEKANEDWIEQETQLVDEGTVPERPSEDDEKYNEGGVFNQDLYRKDETAFEEALLPFAKEFEPSVFSQYAYEDINLRRNKPENKAFYDEIERKKREKEEAERTEREFQKAKQEAGDEISGFFSRIVPDEDEEVVVDDFDFDIN